MTDRTQGILNRASDAPKFSGVRWILGDGVLTNYMQSFVDDTMKRNAVFQSNAGVPPKIVRRSPGWCCEWCAKLEGTYLYPDDVPDDVYRRHDNCNCIVEFYPANGKKQDVWTKEWTKAEPDTLKERKRLGLVKTSTTQLEERKTVGLDEPNLLRDGIGAGRYNEMQSQIAREAGNEKAKAVWDKYHKRVAVADANATKPHYSTDEKSIYTHFHLKERNPLHENGFDTTIHEASHAIDNFASSDPQKYFSSSYKNGEFKRQLIDETKELFENRGKEIDALLEKGDWDGIEKEYFLEFQGWERELYGTDMWMWDERSLASKSIENELRSSWEYSDVSDVLDGGASLNHIYFNPPAGHGAAYWQAFEDNLPREAFAQFNAVSLESKKALATVKKLLPKSYKVYDEMLEEMLSQ